MAAVALGMENALLSDALLSLLEESWNYQSILNRSAALCILSLENSGSHAEAEETEPVLRSFESEGELVVTVGAEYSNKDDVHSFTAENTRYCVDESELRRVFDRFDQNGDGVICEEELRSYMKCCCGKDMTHAEIYSMILSVDSNRDGAIDFKDFLSLYESNISGDETGEEDTGASDHGEALLEAFRAFDTNQDGFISARELQNVLLNLGMPEGNCLVSCEKMIRKVDRDGDGHCDLLEFQEMMCSQAF